MHIWTFFTHFFFFYNNNDISYEGTHILMCPLSFLRWCRKCGKGKARVNIFPQDKKKKKNFYVTILQAATRKCSLCETKNMTQLWFYTFFILISYVNTCTSLFTIKFLKIIYKILFIFFGMVDASISMYCWHVGIIPFLNFSIGKN